MAVSLHDFWKLAIQGGLFAAAERQELTVAFDRAHPGSAPEAKALSAWLIERGMLSRYQAKLLLSGHAGPFHFGDYRVYDRVESGRLAGLFRAGHLQSGQPALLCFLSGRATHDAERWRQIQAQFEQAKEVKHPHVSRADELVNADGYKFVALESLDGVSLADYLRKKPLPVGYVIRYGRKIAAGLSRLHKLGQAHGDVRPENILIDSTGQLKLLYFPLAREPGSAPAPTERNADFLPPEMWANPAHGADIPGDLYALACTFFMLLTGRAAFAGKDMAEKAQRHARDPLPKLPPEVGAPEGLARLLVLMLAKDPDARPRSMNQVGEALASLMGKPDETNGAAASAPAKGAVTTTGRSKSDAKPAGSKPAGSGPAGSGPAGSGPAGSRPESAAPPAHAAEPAQASNPRQEARPRAGQTVPPAAPSPAIAAVAVAPSSMPPGRSAPMGTIVAGGAVVGGETAVPNGMAPPMAAVAPPGQRMSGPQPPPSVVPRGAPIGVAASPRAMPPPAAPPHAMPPQAMPSQAMPPRAVSPMMAANSGAMPGYGAPPPAAMVYAPGQAAPVTPVVAAGYPGQPAPAAAGISAEVLESFAPDPLAERSERREPGVKRKSSGARVNPAYVGAGVAAVALLVGGLVVYSMSNATRTDIEHSEAMDRVRDELKRIEDAAGEHAPPKDAPPKPPTPTNEEGDSENDAKVGGGDTAKTTLIKDDTHTLWASPTAGEPLDLHYLPPGTQVVFALRPADVLSSSDGDKILAALGPEGAAARQELEAMLGMPLGEVEQLLVAFFSLELGAPQLALVARLGQSRTPDELLAAWKNPKQAEGRENYYTGSQWAYYLPAKGENKVFSVAPLKEMAEAGELADDPPPLGKAMEKLLRQTDSDRTFTLLFAPNYLAAAGRPLVSVVLAQLFGETQAFLGDGVGAISLSLNWGEDFFAELRAYSTEESAEEMARRLQDQFGQLSDRLEGYLIMMSPGRYSARLLGRFPQMLRTAGEFMRSDAEEGQAVLRCFLPIAAGHNLLMASELTVTQVGAGAAASLAKAGPKKPATPAEALNQKITLSFTRDTLEKTMEMIGREIDTEIVIRGGDLQLEGITKNQSFGLDEKDKPAREILQTVMLKANTDGKLVYIFKPKNPGEKEIIFITTRAAVEKNRETLPSELAKNAGAAAKPKK